ncbi:TetR/AcrR family transcriptional regulator [Parasphingorhabdus pacifica]
MPQRTNRRELLSDAATEVLARDGGRGLTHRAVDREARVPEGTTKNYFRNRSSLFVAVARRMSDQHIAAVGELRDQIPENVTSEHIVALYAAMLDRMASSARTQFLAMFELYLEGVRRPEVREALGEMTLANADLAVHLHGAVGKQVGARDAGLLDAGVLGVAMSMLSLPGHVARSIGFDDPEELSRALLASAVAGRTSGVRRGFAS